jgi:hypothetical protein
MACRSNVLALNEPIAKVFVGWDMDEPTPSNFQVTGDEGLEGRISYDSKMKQPDQFCA